MLGISIRTVDDLMAALGGCEVSRICAQLEEELAKFRDRPLDERRNPVSMAARAPT